MRRWLANPIASVVLLGVLTADAFTLPRGSNATAAGQIVERVFSSRGLYCYMPSVVYVVHEPTGMRLIDEDHESWDELSGLFSQIETPLVMCDLVSRTSRRGVWSHVTEWSFTGVRLHPVVGEWTSDELAEARATLFGERARTLPSWQWIQHFEDVASADRTSTRILWTGVAHDIFALLVLSALLYSLTGWPAWFAAHPWSRRSRRLARGLCPECGYDTRGLSACPECGTGCAESDPSEPRA
ncbi:MAG: hypothetical protein ACF8LK_01050 [Phycisphaerales bacterium JB041]